MKPEPSPYDPESASERWIDAALSEHARLGRDGADEELVLRILSETVHQRPVVPPAPRFARDWKTAIGAAAAAVALGFFAMSSFRVGSSGERRSGELSFVVRVEAPEAVGKSPVALMTGTTHRIDFDVEAGSVFARSHESVRITADRSGTSSGGMLYEGHVLVECDAFRIEAASVLLPSRGKEPRLLADGVRVVRSTPACVAEAEHLSFDPVSGHLVLTGVTRVETDKGLLASFDPGDRLVLSGGGFSVENARVGRY